MAAEIFHGMNHKRGREGWMTIKADMKKAYDRVEWNFVLKVLEQFGFSSAWVNWVKKCISTSSFSILLNGRPFGRIHPSRGIVKVTPSLLIYLFCALKCCHVYCCVRKGGCLKGIQMGCTAPSISHLLFADDLLLFAKASIQEASTLTACLDKYMAWSVQKVNKSKSSVYFSKNFREQAILSILDQLDFKKLPPKAKHLGFPLLVPRARARAVDEIKAKFLQKISAWKAKILSQAGRTVMLKSVANAIPSYLMNFYLLPKSWCNELDRVTKDFWWGYKEGSTRHLSLKSWKSICVPKSVRGLGIRMFSEMNQSLTSKWTWQMITEGIDFGFELCLGSM